MKYESKIRIFNLPLICISFSEPAVGFIAIGQFAYGFFTIAQFGVGLVFAFGQFTAGAYSIAQFSFGPVMSIGQFAAGWYSIGMIAFGFEGQHMIGWHFIKRNFLSGLAIDFEAIGYSIIYLVLFIALVVLFNMLFGFIASASAYGIKKAIGLLRNKKAPEEEEDKTFFNTNAVVHTIFILLSFFLVWHFLNITGMSSYLDRGKYKSIQKNGRVTEAEILEIRQPPVTINDENLKVLVLKVFPNDREKDPYRVKIYISDGSADYMSVNQRIKIKYDPGNPKRVILAIE